MSYLIRIGIHTTYYVRTFRGTTAGASLVARRYYYCLRLSRGCRPACVTKGRKSPMRPRGDTSRGQRGESDSTTSSVQRRPTESEASLARSMGQYLSTTLNWGWDVKAAVQRISALRGGAWRRCDRRAASAGSDRDVEAGHGWFVCSVGDSCHPFIHFEFARCTGLLPRIQATRLDEGLLGRAHWCSLSGWRKGRRRYDGTETPDGPRGRSWATTLDLDAGPGRGRLARLQYIGPYIAFGRTGALGISESQTLRISDSQMEGSGCHPWHRAKRNDSSRDGGEGLLLLSLPSWVRPVVQAHVAAPCWASQGNARNSIVGAWDYQPWPFRAWVAVEGKGGEVVGGGGGWEGEGEGEGKGEGGGGDGGGDGKRARWERVGAEEVKVENSLRYSVVLERTVQ
ncbi:hypothetical protein MBM_07420 [Drepanopeziza brunnea f. sp. 'multigermtubi' MB_m1]|uniref:Uncharacterized protein n=1 Tax=Marssonina brunnea f. sp. multigermtubi (strain MB_m1) TaxID=1072389 RepID=K1WAC5_MARBU|nr:uncharacterized protein MBM_07420 [Drepanopeziza brunnea f. sp. 'multigermtubi' MB_m1]EKD14190.1 hypothetical protein MBM_07420 [Drepanopeziza brunnea f. sp. 'multigermtubi' MB_m1]